MTTLAIFSQDHRTEGSETDHKFGLFRLQDKTWHIVATTWARNKFEARLNWNMDRTVTATNPHIKIRQL